MSEHHDTSPKIYGVLAEFGDPDSMVAAVRKAKAEGYERLDAYSPYPVSDAADALGFPKSEMGPIMFLGGLLGGTCGFLMQYWTQAVDYPLIIAGRPYNSWPSFIPVTFELTVLTAGLSGLFGLMALCGLPHPHHPLFAVPAFARATRDRFFVCVKADDPKFNLQQTMDFFRSMQPISVEEVPE